MARIKLATAAKRSVALLAGLVIASNAHSAGLAKSARGWAHEPTSFLGLSFDQSVTEQLPECPEVAFLTKVSCAKSLGDTLYKMYAPPQIGVYLSDVLVDDAGSKVGMVLLTIRHTDFRDMLTLLTEKYGRPTSERVVALSTLGGAYLKGRQYTWTGTRVTLMFDEYGQKVDESSVSVTTTDYQKAVAESRKKKVGSFAGNL
ncbi:hypothetical protein [Burkholderia multivorans]|uniref:hypothetical protein n=1 Tax=Burkholderia multivorans TaxID=87883 RepID=UPI001C219B58|nr:hypothetical protein [Burkholderia multivorans]MBU9491751.1 hypothetical protein [Burkholderia multivorans]